MATAPGGEGFTTVDGLQLSARRWANGDAVATAVLVHGFSGSAADPALVGQAEGLRQGGFEVISYDARGHGRSGGDCTLGDLERHDVAAAVALASQRGLPVVVVGASMGAIAALRHVADHGGDLAGAVLVSCPAAWRAPRSLQGAAAAVLTQTRPGRAVARRRLGVRLSPAWSDPEPPVSLARRVTTPTAVVHGCADRFIPPADGVELFRHLSEPRRLDLVPGMGHAYSVLAVAPVVAGAQWALAEAGLTAARP